MSANFMDSTQTWPKSRLTKDLANDAKARIKLTNALDRAKAFVEESDEQVISYCFLMVFVFKDTDDRTREVRDLVQHLYEALEQNNNSSNSQSNKVNNVEYDVLKSVVLATSRKNKTHVGNTTIKSANDQRRTSVWVNDMIGFNSEII